VSSSDKFREIPDASGKKDAVDATDFAPEPTAGSGNDVELAGQEDIYGIGNAEPKHATLGDYLSSITEKNTFGPSGGISTYELEDTANNTPASFDTGGNDSSARTFMDAQTEADIASYFENISGGGDPRTREGGTFTTSHLQKMVDKNNQEDGHLLLSTLEGNDWDDSGIGQTSLGGHESTANDIAEVLVSDALVHNRFSPSGDSPYIVNSEYTAGMYSRQTQYGVYDPEATQVNLGDVARIGLGLVLRQTGDSQDPSDAGATQSLVEGLDVQLALGKVATDQLRPGTVDGITGQSRWEKADVDPTGALITSETIDGDSYSAGSTIIWKGSGNITEMDSFSSKSFGALNSWLEQFDGPLPISMIFITVLAALATLVIAVVLGALLDLIFLLFPASDAEEQASSEPKPMGGAAGTPGFGQGGMGYKIRMWLGVPFLQSGKSFMNCMFQGVIQFFIGDSFLSPTFLGVSAGYYIVICRAAIRDISQITDAMANADFSNPVGAVESIFLIVDAFATSTTFQFLNTLAKLGDMALQGGGVFGKGPAIFEPDGGMDTTAPVVGNLHTKSRTYTNEAAPDYRLAWRFGALPAAYVLPRNLSTFLAEARLTAPVLSDAFSKTEGEFITKMNDTEPGAGRLSRKRVDEIEEALDSTYMPFYFHDLRTNEIIAFHAFLDNITDSFSPEWNEVKGFGRMDPVQIYKSTSRKIGLTFWVIPTSPSDADEAWFAINRLVAMIYPQWSRGTQRISADGAETFIQPFSQVPTASPLVRMRLGDLFQSNYSESGIMRLFGYGTDSFEIKVTDPGGTPDKSLKEVVAKKMADMAGFTAMIDEIKARVATPPDAMDAATFGMAEALGMGGLVGIDAGFKPGDFVLVAPGKYKCAKAVSPPESLFGFSKMMKRYKNKDTAAMKVINIMVTPVSALAAGDMSDDGEKCVVVKKKKKTLKVRYLCAPNSADPKAVEDFKAAVGEDVGAIIVPFENLEENWKLVIDELYVMFLGGVGNITVAEQALIDAGFATAPEPDEFAVATEVAKWFADDGDNPNPVMKSFDEASGKGLAGVITQMDMDWTNGNTIPWDTDYGRKAPQMCKITMGFSPIHDLPLGLDADGAMSNPAYMVGNIVQGMFGGPISQFKKSVAQPSPIDPNIPPPSPPKPPACVEPEEDPDNDTGMD